MRGNRSEVRGILIVRGVLHQTYDEDEAAGEWVTKTFSATFAIEDHKFAGVPNRGDKINIGPTEPALDYWAEVTEIDRMVDGSLRVTAQLDLASQREEVEKWVCQPHSTPCDGLIRPHPRRFLVSSGSTRKSKSLRSP